MWATEGVVDCSGSSGDSGAGVFRIGGRWTEGWGLVGQRRNAAVALVQVTQAIQSRQANRVNEKTKWRHAVTHLKEYSLHNTKFHITLVFFVWHHFEVIRRQVENW